MFALLIILSMYIYKIHNSVIYIPLNTVFDDILLESQNTDNTFVIESSQNINKSHVIASNITILSGNNENFTSYIEIFQSFTIEMNLTLMNLIIKSKSEEFSLFTINQFGSLSIINCQITELNGLHNFTYFLRLLENSNLILKDSLIYQINNTNLISIILSDYLTTISILSCNFSDINIDNTQLINGNGSNLLINSTNFLNLYSFNYYIGIFKIAWIYLSNIEGLTINYCNIFQSSFLSFPFLYIEQEMEIDNTGSIEINFKNSVFSKILSNLYKEDALIVILNVNYEIKFERNRFFDIKANNSIIWISHCNSSYFLN